MGIIVLETGFSRFLVHEHAFVFHARGAGSVFVNGRHGVIIPDEQRRYITAAPRINPDMAAPIARTTAPLFNSSLTGYCE
jgi:hypothetical protein